LAVSIQVNPFYLLIPAVMSASLAFMMHIATAPNLVVFSTHKISLIDMVSSGMMLDVLSVVLTTVFTFALLPPVSL
jgi:sodium-dependent dicarboxylate transporter 2/3/5